VVPVPAQPGRRSCPRRWTSDSALALALRCAAGAWSRAWSQFTSNRSTAAIGAAAVTAAAATPVVGRLINSRHAPLIARVNDVLGIDRQVEFFQSHTRHRADPRVQAVSLQVTFSRPPDSRLPLLSVRPAVISVAFTRWRQPHTVAHI